MAQTQLMVVLGVVASIAAAASAATHVVGGSSTGWTIPSSASFYAQWASSQNFTVGDTIVFSFTTGLHNVMEVPKSSYDGCSSANQIGSTLSTGPATITLTKPGNHYYICGVTGHCSIGQKLAVNVAPSTSSPAPVSAPASTPASAATHVVGGSSTGWTIPSSASFYSQWASSQNFTVGDTLVFNFTTGMHNVMEVPKSSYDGCSSTNQIGSTLSTGPATVTLTKPGNHYYICGVTGHCSIGQKLAINVTPSISSSAPASAPMAAPAFAPTSAPMAAPAFAPTSAPTAAPASAPTAVPVPAPAVSPAPAAIAPSGGSTGLAAGPPTAGPSPAPIAPSRGSGGTGASAGPTSSSKQNPTAVAGPSDGGPSASSAQLSSLSSGYLGSTVIAAFLSAAVAFL